MIMHWVDYLPLEYVRSEPTQSDPLLNFNLEIITTTLFQICFYIINSCLRLYIYRPFQWFHRFHFHVVGVD